MKTDVLASYQYPKNLQIVVLLLSCIAVLSPKDHHKYQCKNVDIIGTLPMNQLFFLDQEKHQAHKKKSLKSCYELISNSHLASPWLHARESQLHHGKPLDVTVYADRFLNPNPFTCHQLTIKNNRDIFSYFSSLT